MVYESDFYTTRRPYRSTPAYSTYTVSPLSRQIRVLPGLGKVHIVHTYDRIIPYVGHKRLTVLTLPPRIYATPSSILQREYDWIENKLRPWVAFSPTNRYLNSDSAMVFSNEARLIRAQTASLLKQIHLPVPRIRTWPITPLNRWADYPYLPARYSNDTYVHKLLTVTPNYRVQYSTYYTEPVKKYIGKGHLSCVSYAGNKSYDRRHPLTTYEDTLRHDIQLLSYYINRFKEEKKYPKDVEVPLSSSRPTRIFSVQKSIDDSTTPEITDAREARAARLAKIYDSDQKAVFNAESILKAQQQKEELRLAEERALAEEKAKKKAEAKKQEEARRIELTRQEELAAQTAAERAAELERQAEKARQEKLARQAEIELQRQLEEENIRKEDLRRLEEAKAEEERQQLLRLEEIARQAEEDKEAELARQAQELAELARQEAERAELERLEQEQKEKKKREEELAELERQEAELAELAKQEEELAELARQEAELAELQELSELTQQAAEIANEEPSIKEDLQEENKSESDEYPVKSVEKEENNFVELEDETRINQESADKAQDQKVTEAADQPLDRTFRTAPVEEEQDAVEAEETNVEKDVL